MGGGRKVKILAFLVFFFPTLIHALEELSEEERQEAFSFGQKNGEIFRDQYFQILKSLWGNADPLIKSVSKEPLLDAKTAKKACDSHNFPAEQEISKQIKKKLSLSLEPTDIPLSKEIEHASDHPQTVLGSLPTETSTSSQIETSTCQEKGTSLHTVLQERQVTLIPEVKKTIYYCRGHKSKKYSKWDYDSIEKIKIKWGTNKNVKVQRWEEWGGKGLSDFKLIVHYTHIPSENKPCGHFSKKNQIVSAERIESSWNTSEIKELERLEDNPDCSLLQVEEFDSEPRYVQGKVVHQDFWQRKLRFSCSSSSKQCERLRKEGALLINRKCLKEEGGDCILWEKTYQTGEGNTQTTFDNTSLIELNLFDTASPSTKDFGKTMSILSAISSIGADQEERPLSLEDFAIFNGDNLQCRRAFNTSVAFDCCPRSEGKGFCIRAGMGKCNQEEQDLFERNKLGQCRRIGKISGLVLREYAYCCFPSKLARIIHEEGRKQLGISWGTPSNPNCRALTIDELKQLDFSSMDLGEIIEDFREKVDEEKLREAAQEKAAALMTTVSETSLREKTESLVAEEIAKAQKNRRSP